MTVVDTVADGRARVRVRPWRGQPTVGEVTVLPAGIPVGRLLVRRAIERAGDRGFVAIVTPALPRSEWRPFLDEGFVVREHLHLLGHDLLDLPRAGHVRTSRATRRDHERVLDIDRGAFEPFWQFDRTALHDALDATPSVRFRITRSGDAYVLVGKSRDRGYLQRLAVLPDAQGRGTGSALVADALAWLRRWRVREALVNTQTDNERAIALYERLGFRRRRDGLAVLERRLDAGEPGATIDE